MNPKALAWLVVATLLLAAACSDDDDDTARAESVVDQTSGTTDEDEATDDSDSNAGSDDSDDGGSSGEMIGTARAQLPATINDPRMVPLRIDVLTLERNGDLIELEMVLTNEAEAAGDDPPAFNPWSTFVDQTGGASTRDDLSGIGLIDQGEQKIYLPVYDSEDRCLCTADLAPLEVLPGESVSLNATFGGVPDDVETLDLNIPQFPAITGLVVQ